jgi:hypothetical protein
MNDETLLMMKIMNYVIAIVVWLLSALVIMLAVISAIA